MYFELMALINCSECGSQMSDKAQSCPKCGAPNPNSAPQMQQFAYHPQQFAYQPQAMFNPCGRHPQAPAVATCGNCGTAMCKECKDLAWYTMDNKPMCIDCNLLYMQERVHHLKSTKRWSMVKFILLAIIILLALAIWQDKPNDWNNIFAAWIVAAIGGIFTTLSFTGRSEGEKAADELYTRLNPEDGYMYQGAGCLGRIVGAVLLAPLYTVGYAIKHLYRWISSTASLRTAKRELEEYTALIQEHENHSAGTADENGQQMPGFIPATNQPHSSSQLVQQDAMQAGNDQQSPVYHSHHYDIHSKSSDKTKQYMIAAVVFAVLSIGGYFLITNFSKSNSENATQSENVAEGISQSMTLHGSVDKYPITMQLNINGSVVKGSYYYNKKGPDALLTLSGVLDNGEMDIYESDENGRQTGHFHGYFSNGNYEGEFVTIEGKSMTFRVSQ